jgi:hypothetical protein
LCVVFVPRPFADLLYEFGYTILENDKKDIGQFANARHPSVIHHWQAGLFMMILGEIGRTIDNAKRQVLKPRAQYFRR